MVEDGRLRIGWGKIEKAVVLMIIPVMVLMLTFLVPSGTWVPLERGREIAKLYNVEEILLPIFDFRPSTESPPLAPKHVTAASSKPRPARANARAAPAPRRALSK